MRALFYENCLGIKKSVSKFVYLFFPNTGTKYLEPFHSNHVIPHRENDDICLHLSAIKSVRISERYAKFTTKLGITLKNRVQ